MTRRTAVATAVFYGGLTVLMLAIVTDTLSAVLPVGVARRVANNSEGFLFALLLAGWIQFVLPRLTPRGRWLWAGLAAVVCALAGIGLIASDLPARIRTLNETALALALLIPYVCLRRPVGAWAPISAVAWIAVVVVGIDNEWVIDLAETIGFLVLTPIALDVVDRGILEPDAPTDRRVRGAWYAVLLVIPVVVSTIGLEARDGDDALSLTLDYLGRVHESFIGVLLVVLLLAVGLGRTGRGDHADGDVAAGAARRT